MRITGRDNARIKEIHKLITSGRARRERGLFVVEGVRICTDALRSRIGIETLVYSDSAAQRYPEQLELLRAACETELSVPNDLFDKISDTKSPQGVLCVCKTPRLRLPIEQIVQGGKYLALESLSDPANLGTIARTAEALGIDGLILSSGSCDPYSPKALRAGMGSLLRIPLVVADDFIALIEALQQKGLRAYAAVPARDAVAVTKLPLCDGGIVMIGNEGNGLSEEAKAVAQRVTIPMAGRAESLNAAAAAAIMMWEMCRA